MLKRGMTFLGVFILALVIYFQGRQLHLAYFVFFPVMVFLVFYFWVKKDMWLLLPMSLMVVVLWGLGFHAQPSLEVALMGGGSLAVFGILCGYQTTWLRLAKEEAAQERRVKNELREFKEKFQTRTESLRRLENQVSRLNELFVIARDFSECLTFEMMTKLLREKVMPELPCRLMRFLVLTKEEKTMSFQHHFVMTSAGVEESPLEFSQENADLYLSAYESKQLVKRVIAQNPDGIGVEENLWIFPISIEGRVSAFLTVEGADAEDFVRFEVLVAHLVLQVKKIQLYSTVKELSILDGLTGLYVRRHFLDRFQEELQRSIKFGLPLTVLMLDIDHFKRYNDEFGHLVGDATLREVAAILRENLRKVDIVARYGGEEFVAVLPETTGTSALEVAERIRSSIARRRFKVYDVEAQVTVSLGISLYPSDIPENRRGTLYRDLGFDLIRHADKALYRAKEEGRNRVYRYHEL